MHMSGIREYRPEEYGARPDGETLCTRAIQEAIDAAAAAGGGRVVLGGGVYVTGALFVKSKVELCISREAELRGVVDESAYPAIRSRVAGIEMDWPAALINVIGQEDVVIGGGGKINGQGEYWWKKYWGTDRLGGMRKDYTARGLRWAVDYDCGRPRNVLVHESRRIRLEYLRLIRSPFWNVHICYSEHVTVDRLDIRDNRGPSTDGIDIDSSAHVLVENCYIDCNDDNLCLKSGRDADGLRVNRPTEHVVIRNCVTGRGGGITIGSETSGGVRDVEIYNIRAERTENGVRLKSARTRGGLIEDIRVHDIEMIDVPNPFSFQLNWNPSYSYAQLPADWEGEVPAHWKVLAAPVIPEERGIPEFRNIEIRNVRVRSAGMIPPSHPGGKPPVSKAFDVGAYPEKPIRGIRWKDIDIETHTSGSITHARDWTMENVKVRTLDGQPARLESCVNVQQPEWGKIGE
jgi:polygalacturonase